MGKSSKINRNRILSKAKSITPSTSLKVVEEVLSDLCHIINTPRSLTILILLKEKMYDELVKIDIDPMHYNCPESFFGDYICSSIVKKYEGFPTSFNKTKVAFENFLAAELQCKKTNKRFQDLNNLGPLSKDLLDLSHVTFLVREEVKKIIGDSVPSLFEILELGNFGPGVTSSHKGANVTYGSKYNTKPGECDISHGLADMLLQKVSSPIEKAALYGISSNHDIVGDFTPVSQVFPATDVASLFNISGVDGPFSLLESTQFNRTISNSLTFVPKTAKTDRAICVEPHINTIYQKGLGKFLRRRLQINGIDLSKQQGFNALYARKGSIDNDFATIDLSAASDTISYELVQHILPPMVLEHLERARSPFTQISKDYVKLIDTNYCGEGKLLRNEKFSSMGNGATFELETIIFLAIARVSYNMIRKDTYRYRNWSRIGDVSCNDIVMSFGDDLIVPTDIAKILCDNLVLLGFKVNQEKSFTEGPFRESCGKDYFLGRLVRPFFIKKELTNVQSLYTLANGLYHLSYRYAGDNSFHAIRTRVIRRIDKRCRYFGPAHLGDSVLCTEHPRPKAENGVYYFMVLSALSARSDECAFRSNVVRAIMHRSFPSSTSIRGTLQGFTARRVQVGPNWTDEHYRLD